LCDLSGIEPQWLIADICDAPAPSAPTEIGIEPTVRHGADLGFIPVVISDACGAGDKEAGERALANLDHFDDAIIATTDEVCKAISGTV